MVNKSKRDEVKLMLNSFNNLQCSPIVSDGIVIGCVGFKKSIILYQ